MNRNIFFRRPLIHCGIVTQVVVRGGTLRAPIWGVDYMFYARPSWRQSPPISGYDKSAAEGHLSWRIQLGMRREEDHSDIRELIGEPLGPGSNEPLRSSAVTRLIWLADLRVHPFLKVILKKSHLGVSVKRRRLKFRNEIVIWMKLSGGRLGCEWPVNMLRWPLGEHCDLIKCVELWRMCCKSAVINKHTLWILHILIRHWLYPEWAVSLSLNENKYDT